jgi:hypothetical protein
MPDDESTDTQTATTDGETTMESTVTTETATTATTIATTASETSTSTVVASTATAQVVYVGPKLRTPYPVVPKTIFRGALPMPLAAALADDEDLAACFVPVDDFGAALVALKRDGTAISRSVAAVTARYVTKKEG